MSLSTWSAMRCKAKDGPRRAAYRDAAPDGISDACDPGAGAVDRNAERSGEVWAEKVEPCAGARDNAVHLAAEPWAADRERERCANAEAPARADREPGRSDASSKHSEASSTRDLHLRIGAGPGAPAEHQDE